MRTIMQLKPSFFKANFFPVDNQWITKRPINGLLSIHRPLAEK